MGVSWPVTPLTNSRFSYTSPSTPTLTLGLKGLMSCVNEPPTKPSAVRTLSLACAPLLEPPQAESRSIKTTKSATHAEAPLPFGLDDPRGKMPEIMPNLLAIGDQLRWVIPAVNYAAQAQLQYETCRLDELQRGKSDKTSTVEYARVR